MDYTEIAESLIKTVEDSTVKTIHSQLEHLINKGILKVKKNEGKFFRKSDGGKLEFGNEIELELDSSEYIKKLELQNDKLIGENKHLRQLIKTLSQIAGEA
jgi:predicted transcriptional regulator